MPAWVALLIAALLSASCGGGSADAPREAGDSATEAVRAAPEELTGVVVDVRGEGLGRVRGFTLKVVNRTYEVLVDPQADYSFPPDHLRAHMVGGEPVRVELSRRAGNLYATQIEDA